MSYLASTTRRAERILGYGINTTSGTRKYTIISDKVFSVVYADLFGSITSITDENGNTVTDYQLAFNGKNNGLAYYNEIWLPGYVCGSVTIDASWGSSSFDTEITSLLTWLEANQPNLSDSGISSKKIEDFSISLRTASEQKDDLKVLLDDGYGYYIRKPLIIDVSREERHNERYF